MLNPVLRDLTEMCEDGLYLQPSLHRMSLLRGATVS